jgi:hypothetical protein
MDDKGSKIGSSDVEALRTYGFTEQQILEAVLLVGWRSGTRRNEVLLNLRC